MKNKTTIIIIIISILAIALASQVFAKSKYHSFTQKQFKIKYDAKLWNKHNGSTYLKLKYKSEPKKTKLQVKKVHLGYKGRKYLKDKKTAKFASIYNEKIKTQFKSLQPAFHSVRTFKIKKKKNYKVILMKYSLYPGELNVYYLTNKTTYHQFATICKKTDCNSANLDFNKIIQSYRILKDTESPTFAGATTAVSTSISSITISWVKATDNCSESKYIKYLIYQANQLEEEDYNTINYTTSQGATSYTLTNLQESTSYYFVVRAQDEAGNVDTNTYEAIATTKATSNNDPVAGSIQNVSYESNGSTVLGRMYRPNGAGPFKAIVFNHGGVTPSNPSDNDARINQLRQGDTYAVLATAYRGDIGSEGIFSLSIGDVNDALAAIEYLKSKSYIDSSKIGMFGESRGGNVTLSTAERTTDPKAVVTWYPFTDTITFCQYKGISYCLTNFGFASTNAATDYSHYLRISSPVNFTSHLTTPLQNSHATDDSVVPYSQSTEFNAAMTGHSNYTFYEYTSGDHGVGAIWSTTALTRMYEFFASYL